MKNLKKLGHHGAGTFCSKSGFVYRESLSHDDLVAVEPSLMQQLMSSYGNLQDGADCADARNSQQEVTERAAHQTRVEGLRDAEAMVLAAISSIRGAQLRNVYQTMELN